MKHFKMHWEPGTPGRWRCETSTLVRYSTTTYFEYEESRKEKLVNSSCGAWPGVTTKSASNMTQEHIAHALRTSKRTTASSRNPRLSYLIAEGTNRGIPRALSVKAGRLLIQDGAR